MKRPARSKALVETPPGRTGGASRSANGTPTTGIGGIPLPSTDPATNFLVADIVLRAAGDLLREVIEKKTLTTASAASPPVPRRASRRWRAGWC